MEAHNYRVKDRHDRAVDYINDPEKYSRNRRMMIVAIILLLYTAVELLT